MWLFFSYSFALDFKFHIFSGGLLFNNNTFCLSVHHWRSYTCVTAVTAATAPAAAASSGMNCDDGVINLYSHLHRTSVCDCRWARDAALTHDMEKWKRSPSCSQTLVAFPRFDPHPLAIWLWARTNGQTVAAANHSLTAQKLAKKGKKGLVLKRNCFSSYSCTGNGAMLESLPLQHLLYIITCKYDCQLICRRNYRASIHLSIVDISVQS